MKNLTINNIVQVVGGTLYNAEKCIIESEVSGVVIDSRKVELNYLFLAVKGERVDGHDFVEDVFLKGASCVVVEHEIQTTRPYILVESSLDALKKIAVFYREQLDIPVVGITGSVGKTSTKEFISSVLEQKYTVLKTEGNYNNEIGVPLTLLRIKEEHNAAVIEMGISDFGEMHRLSSMAKPTICVLTNIGLCHLENLGDRDGVLKAKSEIFDFASKDCTVVLNGDDDKLRTITQVNGKRPMFYGVGDASLDVCAQEIETKGVYGTSARIKIPDGEQIAVDFALPGKHMVYNAMSAIAVGLILGVSQPLIQKGIADIKSVGGRLNIIETESYTLIDDCYNANPVSVKASLDVLDSASSRKVAILGDMFELGSNENELHYGVGEYLAQKDISLAIFIGKLSENTHAGAKKKGSGMETYWYETVDDALMFLDLMLKDGDTILIKASHSMHFERIVDTLK